MSAFYHWVMTDESPFLGWQTVGGPLVLLVGIASTIVVGWLTGRIIGDVSCRWTLSYSPKNGAFGIWSIIYPWHFACILLQFFYSFDATSFYVAKFESNLLVGLAWASSSAWIFFFGLADSPDPAMGLGLAAFFLLVAALCCTSAVLTENGFAKQASAVQILSTSVPFSILASWLCVAASLSIGIFVESTRREPLCARDPAGSGQPVIPDPAGLDRWVPLGLAAVISVLSLWQFNFVLPLPVIWAIAFMKTDTVKLVSIVLLAFSCLASVILFVNARVT